MFVLFDNVNKSVQKFLLNKPHATPHEIYTKIKHEFKYIKSLFLDIANFIAMCYESNILHNDIKFENVLLDDEKKKAFVADLGYACEKGEIMEGSPKIGTDPYYDEKVVTDYNDKIKEALSDTSEGQKVKLKFTITEHDIFSFGIMLFSMFFQRGVNLKTVDVEGILKSIPVKVPDVNEIKKTLEGLHISNVELDQLRNLIIKCLKRDYHIENVEDFRKDPWLQAIKTSRGSDVGEGSSTDKIDFETEGTYSNLLRQKEKIEGELKKIKVGLKGKNIKLNNDTYNKVVVLRSMLDDITKKITELPPTQKLILTTQSKQPQRRQPQRTGSWSSGHQ
tara:strand:- start:360 stop:1364 length:1005 start_codon:yes stop_codon:yes gene_type:complete